jgi:two-component system, OmpR family, sensor histidine kinase BaeS
VRPDSNSPRGRLPAGRGLLFRLTRSLLGRLLLANLAAVAAATLLAGLGALAMADMIIVRGDMMMAEHYAEFRRQIGWYLLAVGALTFGVAGGVSWYLSRSILRPVGRIRQVAEAVAAGDYRPRLREPAGASGLGDPGVALGLRDAGGDELSDLAAAIDRMTESLARVEQLRRDLVANVAHELRTPLTSAHGLLCAVRDRLIPADEHAMEQVAEELSRLIRLVDALHQLSVSDAAHLRTGERRRIDAGALLQEVAAGMLPLFEVRRQELIVTTGPSPAWVKADRDSLVQVLVNLLENASKYGPEGEPVQAACAVANGAVLLSVTNGGPGIDPADLPRIFERFYRTEKSRSRESGGAGIGLAIVKNLVEAHGGAVMAESRPDETCFRVRLPAL